MSMQIQFDYDIYIIHPLKVGESCFGFVLQSEKIEVGLNLSCNKKSKVIGQNCLVVLNQIISFAICIKS